MQKDKLDKTAKLMAEITQKYLDKLPPKEKERKVKDFKKKVEGEEYCKFEKYYESIIEPAKRLVELIKQNK